MAVPVDTWASAENARRYAEFARTYATYQQPSRDVIELACPAVDATVVDLACGTGVDAVVCNSAIWQTEIRLTATAVRHVLHPGGRFVFNLGASMLADRPCSDQPDPLVDAMKEIAVRDYGWSPTPPDDTRADRRELSEAWLRQTLHEVGLEVDRVKNLSHQASLEEQRAWLSVPVFTSGLFGPLPYEQRMVLLNNAYQRLAADRPQPVTTHWVVFVAIATS